MKDLIVNINDRDVDSFFNTTFDAVSMSTEGSVLDTFTSFVNNVEHILVKIKANFTEDTELAYRTKILSKDGKRIMQAASKLTYLDEMEVLFPIMRGLDTNLNKFTNSNLKDITSLIRIVHKNIDMVNRLVLESTSGKAASTSAKTVRYFKASNKEVSVIKASFRSHFSETDHTVVTLRTLLHSFSEIPELLTSLGKLGKLFDSKTYKEIRTRIRSLTDVMEVVLQELDDTNTMDKSTSTAVSESFLHTAQSIELLSAMVYASTSIVGTTESISIYIKSK